MLHSWLPHNLYLRIMLAMIVFISLGLAGLTAIAVNESQTRLTKELLVRGQHQVDILASAANISLAQQDLRSSA